MTSQSGPIRLLSTGDGVARKPPSIRDVAQAAQVSHQTVSRVLNHSTNIRQETRDRVLAVMAELRYRPNWAARTLSTNRSDTIGLLSSGREEHSAVASIKALEDAARAYGRRTLVASVNSGDERSVLDAVGYLLLQNVEALVVISPLQRVVELAIQNAPTVPVVTLRSAAVGWNPCDPSEEEIEGGRLAAAHLLDLGHRSVRHLAGPEGSLEARGRRWGFERELARRGIPLLPRLLGDWTADSGYRAGIEFLCRNDSTAYFCANDQMAIGLMHAARDLGIDVPEQLSVIGYDDAPGTAHLRPPLTTIRTDYVELGRLCMLRLGSGTGPTVNDPKSVTAPHLVIRASTRSLDAA